MVNAELALGINPGWEDVEEMVEVIPIVPNGPGEDAERRPRGI